MLEIHHLVKNFGPLGRGRRRVVRGRARRGAGLSRPQRRRQIDDDEDDHRLSRARPPAPRSSAATTSTRSRSRPSGSIGYLPEGAPAYPDMTPADFLGFIAHIRGFAGAEARRAHRPSRRDDPDRARSCTSRSRPCRRASSAASGWRRRCCTIRTVLILDEPTDGLDPNQKHEVRKHHRGDAAGKGDHHLDPSARGGRSGVQPRDHHRPRPDPRRRHAGRARRALAPSQRRAPRRRRPATSRRCAPSCCACRRVAAVETVADGEGDGAADFPARRRAGRRRGRRSRPRPSLAGQLAAGRARPARRRLPRDHRARREPAAARSLAA